MIGRSITRPDGSVLLVFADTFINSFGFSEVGKEDGKAVLYSISSGAVTGDLLLTTPSDLKADSDRCLDPGFVSVTTLTDDELKVRLSDLVELSALIIDNEAIPTDNAEGLLGMLLKVLEIMTDLSKARLVVKSCRASIVYGLDVVYERKLGSVLYKFGLK